MNNTNNTNERSTKSRNWRKFKRNRLALAGLVIIAIAVLVSLLGYLITPDHSPFANEQKPELHVLAPGSKAQFLLVKRSSPIPSGNLLTKLLHGSLDQTLSYSAFNYRFESDKIIVEEYTGNTPNNGEQKSFSIAEVVFAVDATHPIAVNNQQGTIQFRKTNSETDTTALISDLQALIKKEHLITKTFWLGTDVLGRDVLSRLLIGTRISLAVGLISVAISIVIGLILGSVAGFFRGKLDIFISWFFNVVWSIPTILLVIAITLVLGKGILQVFIAVGLTMWVDVARLVRGQVLSIREKEFVEAGRALGYSNWRIIFKHVIPNVMGPVIVMAANNFASAILMEAGLSFLGLGAQPPLPSWGEMINAHRGYILMDKAYLAFIPGGAIMVLVLAFMMVGNGLRDALDTKMGEGNPIV